MIYFVYDKLIVMYQNINGLLNKANLLAVHLDELEDLGKSVDIICVTEHNMNKEDLSYYTKLLSCG